MSYEELSRRTEAFLLAREGEDLLRTDCESIAFLLAHCEIEIPSENRFFVSVNCADLHRRKSIGLRLAQFPAHAENARLAAGEEALAYTGDYDFGHTSPFWEDVITLGIYGLRERIADYAKKYAERAVREGFYESLLLVYDAALRFLRRAGEAALACGKTEMGESLLHLCERQPESLYEAMQTSIIYYTLQQFFDGTALRTLGRLDHLFYPFYQKTDKTFAETCLTDYLLEIDRFEATANLPFALGGSSESGEASINELSELLLETYGRLPTENTKLHLLCSDETPTAFLETALRLIRAGKNSIVFLSDRQIIRGLERLGAEHADAVRYHVVGCYECGAEGELTCSCNARVNLPKALELAINGGRDMLTEQPIGLVPTCRPETYEQLFAEFSRQVEYLCGCAMRLTDLCEARYPHIHTAPFLSATYRSALARGGDLYADYAAKYNNSSVNALGLATVTDALAAIRKLVFEDRTLTLDELTEILKSNWKDREPLRLLIKNKYPKYGQGDARTDAIAARVVELLSDAIGGKPNVKGGVYRLGLFSINWRWPFGEKTAASADGRRAGETLSQNTSASFGADTEGATAHLLSGARIDTVRTPNGAIVDLDLHASAVRGENGLRALVSSLKGYLSLGGFAVHYNVLDTDVLRDAKRNPQKYPTLQVRLCGWNVLFSSLDEREQEEFIARSML